MSGTDVREVRAHMLAAADGLLDAQRLTIDCAVTHYPTSGPRSYRLPQDTTVAMAYAEGVLRTLAATILPPDPPARSAPAMVHPSYGLDPVSADTEQHAGGKARAATAVRDGHGRFLPREAP